MFEVSREIFKSDPTFNQVYALVKKHHIVAGHTQKTLYKNRHVKDFCEEARHFMIMQGKYPIYIHYDVSNWFKEPDGVQVRIESIAFYDGFMEYEAARLRGLHSGRKSDIPNIN